METIYLFLLIIPAFFLFHFIRFKLTRWEEFVHHFESVKRYELEYIYGFWSEFRQSTNSYPLSNLILKVAVIPFGLYLQYDLKYEPIKFYKPVIIPWENISIAITNESKGKGSFEFIISKNEQHLGSIFIQAQISEQIISETKNIGVNINFA